MSEQKNRRGKREAGGRPDASAGYWSRYKAWVAGLNKGQRVRYRLLQAAVILSLVIIIGFAFLQAWIRVPDVPGGDGVQINGSDVSFDNADTPDVDRGQRPGVYTFLLVGKDTTSGSTDTMLLITYDTNEKTIRGLNLPRDTMVNVSTNSKRLNAVYNYNKGKDKETQVENGMAALKKEVANLTGITPNFYVLVEWEAIGELVDALGGVEFEVPFDMDYDDPYQDLYIHQKAGLRVLSGDDAMQVIRHRKNNDGSHSNGDVGRLQIQQDFLKAVAKKCLQPATFLKIPSLVEIFVNNVTTDLTVGNILAFAQLAYGMNPDEGVSFVTAPIGASFTYRGAAMVTLDETQLLEILNGTMNPYYQEIRGADLQLLYRKSNGTFDVTNGVLADEKIGQVQASGNSSTSAGKADQPEEPAELPEEPVDPNEGQEIPEEPGDSSQGTGEVTSPDSSQGEQIPPDGGQTGESGGEESGQEGGSAQSGGGLVDIDPDQVLPDPNEGKSQDSGGETESELPAA